MVWFIKEGENFSVYTKLSKTVCFWCMHPVIGSRLLEFVDSWSTIAVAKNRLLPARKSCKCKRSCTTCLYDMRYVDVVPFSFYLQSFTCNHIIQILILVWLSAYFCKTYLFIFPNFFGTFQSCANMAAWALQWPSYIKGASSRRRRREGMQLPVVHV